VSAGWRLSARPTAYSQAPPGRLETDIYADPETPSLVEIARRIREALQSTHATRDAWIEATFDLGRNLKAARLAASLLFLEVIVQVFTIRLGT
jgi:hypothetical protein